MPAILLPRRDPGERAERPRDGGTHDRRLRPNREDVRADRGERPELSRQAG